MTNTAPTLGFVQDFEADANGILTDGGRGSVTHVPSGSSIVTADGAYALVTDSVADGGPFTRFDGYRSEFVDGLTASVDVYIDINWALGEGFDYSVAVNGTTGNHLRDFVFQVAKDTSTQQLLIGAATGSNFAPNENLEMLASHGVIISSGWYTLQHVFRNDAGNLSVDFNLIAADGTVAWNTTVAATDPIAAVGGNRYGWFTDVTVAGGLAIDNLTLGDYSGVVTEVADKAAGEGVTNLTTEGVIPFADADVGDSHSVSFAADGTGYLGTFSAEISNSGADGSGAVTWSFSVSDSALDHLDAGDTLTQTYTVTIDDGYGGTASQDVTITINGASDTNAAAPTLGFVQAFGADTAGVIADGRGSITRVASGPAGANYAVVTEEPSPSGTDGDGPFTRFDGYRAEFIDGLTASVDVYLDVNWADGQGFEYDVAASDTSRNYLRDFIFQITKDSGTHKLLINASNGSGFAPNENLDSIIDTGEITSTGWYTLQHVFRDGGGHLAVDFNLINAAGVTVWTKTIETTDAIPAQVGGNRYGWFTDVTVPGGLAIDNLTLGDVSGAVTEIADKAAGEGVDTLTADGMIPFKDADIGDSHTVSFAADGTGYLGTFSAVVSNSGADGEGAVTWSFSVADSAVNYLRAGQTLTQTYTVTIDDGQGGTDSQDVTITITGANDGPVASGTYAHAVIDTSGADTYAALTGTLVATDADTGDSRTWSGSMAGTYGTLTVNANGTYSYAVNAAAVNALPAGSNPTDSFVATVTDGQGATDTRTITINLTGSNDAPTGAVTISGMAAIGQTLTANSTLGDADGMGALSYQWQADGANIDGANGASFLLTGAQTGKAISVVVSYTDNGGTHESVTGTLAGLTGSIILGTTRPEVLTGTAGDDIIDGRPGRDTLVGGQGSDTYWVNEARDLVVENADAGIDTVISTVSYTLAANVENLTLGGTGSVFGKGNGLNNAIVGNGASNVLNGFGGQDTLTGGLGTDTFTFSTAADTPADAPDVITDFSAAQRDKIDLRGIDARDGMSGNQAFRFIGTSEFSGNASGLLRFDAATHMLLGSTDADWDAEIAIVLVGVDSILAANMML